MKQSWTGCTVVVGSERADIMLATWVRLIVVLKMLICKYFHFAWEMAMSVDCYQGVFFFKASKCKVWGLQIVRGACIVVLPSNDSPFQHRCFAVVWLFLIYLNETTWLVSCSFTDCPAVPQLSEANEDCFMLHGMWPSFNHWHTFCFRNALVFWYS